LWEVVFFSGGSRKGNPVRMIQNSYQFFSIFTSWTWCRVNYGLMSGMVYTGVKVRRMDLEMGGLVEWPWLQLMCCAACLPCGCNFRWWEEVQDGSECWLVCCYWTPEIKFNKRLSLLIIRLVNYSVTTSFIYKQIV